MSLQPSEQLLSFPYDIVIEIFSYNQRSVNTSFSHRKKPFYHLLGRFKRDPMRKCYMLYTTCRFTTGSGYESFHEKSKKEQQNKSIGASLLFFLSNVRVLEISNSALSNLLFYYLRFHDRINIKLQAIDLYGHKRNIVLTPSVSHESKQLKLTCKHGISSLTCQPDRAVNIFRRIGSVIRSVKDSIDIKGEPWSQPRAEGEIDLLSYATDINTCSVRLFLELSLQQKMTVRKLEYITQICDFDKIQATLGSLNRECASHEFGITHFQIMNYRWLSNSAVSQIISALANLKHLRSFAALDPYLAPDDDVGSCLVTKISHLMQLPETLEQLQIFVTVGQFQASAINRLKNLQFLGVVIWVTHRGAAQQLVDECRAIADFFGKRLTTNFVVKTPRFEDNHVREEITAAVVTCRNILETKTDLQSLDYSYNLTEGSDSSSDEEMEYS